MLRGLNHITIAVSDLDRAFHFYVDLLGLKPHARWAGGAYLSLPGLWLCLSVEQSQPARDYTHIAFDIKATDFPRMQQKLQVAGVREWKQNQSEGDSLYLLDPDGHKLEIHAGSLQSRLNSLQQKPYKELQLY
ncbi:fosfomycin resistance glutathione transferase [Spongorhabdus nitratireducens]